MTMISSLEIERKQLEGLGLHAAGMLTDAAAHFEILQALQS